MTEWLGSMLFIVAYVVLMRWLLPYLGIST